MKLPLFSKKQENASHQDDEVLNQLDALQKATQLTEEEKEAKRLARAEKKFLKEQKLKRQRQERLVAPLLLLATMMLSLLFWVLSR